MSKYLTLLSLAFFYGCMASPTELQFESAAIRSPSSLEFQANLQMSDRQYVQSVLASAFDTAGTSQESPLLQLTLQRSEFGGPCDKYEASEKDASNSEFYGSTCFTGLTANTSSSSNPARYSLTMNICQRLVNDTARFNSFMAKIYGTGTVVAPNAASIKKAYGVFFREEVPSDDVVKAFSDLAANTTVNDGWKKIVGTLCIAPEWQVL